MTGQERRIAELAAQDMESWALELPHGSETRQDLQQTARAYRFVARAGAVALRAVPGGRPQENEATRRSGAGSRPGVDRSSRPALAEAPRELHPRLGRGA